MSHLDRYWWAGGWALVAAAVYFSLGPQALDNGLQNGDKLNHFVGYGALMFWFAQLPLPRLKLAAACVGLGVALEFAQGLSPNRQPELLDAAANTLGVTLGWLAAVLLPNLRRACAQRFHNPESRL